MHGGTIEVGRHAGWRCHLLRAIAGALSAVSAQILLVDDEANIRRMLGALLREEGIVGDGGSQTATPPC